MNAQVMIATLNYIEPYIENKKAQKKNGKVPTKRHYRKSILQVNSNFESQISTVFELTLPNILKTHGEHLPPGINASEISQNSIFTSANSDLQEINFDKIAKMSNFESGWNGNHGLPFTATAINSFKQVIQKLTVQPQIAPTGRNSLLLQYEKKDGTLLTFELKEHSAEMVYVPFGDYKNAITKVIENNVTNTIVECVGKLYGSK